MNLNTSLLTWPNSAPATLDFGGAWVSAGTPRHDLMASDISLSIDGLIIDPQNVKISRHPKREGLYYLSWSADGKREGAELTVTYDEGAIFSPLHGTLSGFSTSVVLEDCAAPQINAAYVLAPSGYDCVDVDACAGYNKETVSVVILVEFTEMVYSVMGGGLLASTDLSFSMKGGIARVNSTYVVTEVGAAPRRRTQWNAGASEVAVALVLTSAAIGKEQVTVRAQPRAIRDGAGWFVGHADEDARTAFGNIANPFANHMQAVEAMIALRKMSVRNFFVSSAGIAVILALCGACLFLLVCTSMDYHRRRRALDNPRPSVRQENRTVYRPTNRHSFARHDFASLRKCGSTAPSLERLSSSDDTHQPDAATDNLDSHGGQLAQQAHSRAPIAQCLWKSDEEAPTAQFLRERLRRVSGSCEMLTKNKSTAPSIDMGGAEVRDEGAFLGHSSAFLDELPLKSPRITLRSPRRVSSPSGSPKASLTRGVGLASGVRFAPSVHAPTRWADLPTTGPHGADAATPPGLGDSASSTSDKGSSVVNMPRRINSYQAMYTMDSGLHDAPPKPPSLQRPPPIPGRSSAELARATSLDELLATTRPHSPSRAGSRVVPTPPGARRQINPQKVGPPCHERHAH